MKRFFQYFRLQLKRMMRDFPVIFLMSIGLLAGVGALLYLQYRSAETDTEDQKVSLGIVGDPSVDYIGLGITLLENFDTSRYTLNLTELDNEKTAMRMLESGEISGYLYIPENFVESISIGDNYQITYVTGGSQMGLGAQLVKECADVISALITENQAGIYSMEDIFIDYNATAEELNDAIIDLNIDYVNLDLSREDMYQIETVTGSHTASAIGYYFCAAALLLLLLWGMNGAPLLIHDDLSLSKLLSVRGFPFSIQICAEYLSYLCLMAANFAGIFIILFFSGVAGLIPELADSAELLRIAVGIIPVVICVAALQFFLYTLADSLISGLLLNFTGAIILAFLSGCFYPLAYFPKIIRSISVFLPTEAGMEYLQNILLGSSSMRELFILILYSLLFLVLSAAIRRFRIRQQ